MNHIRKPKTVFDAVAVSSTTAYTSIVTELFGGQPVDALYTFESTSTATGSVQIWANNKSKLEYDADVVAAGSEAANTAGWCKYGAATSVTAAFAGCLPLLTRFPAGRIRLVYTNATSTGTITARISFA